MAVLNVMRVIVYWSCTELGIRAGRPTPLALSLIVQQVAKEQGFSEAAHTADLIHAVFEKLADPKSIIVGQSNPVICLDVDADCWVQVTGRAKRRELGLPSSTLLMASLTLRTTPIGWR